MQTKRIKHGVAGSILKCLRTASGTIRMPAASQPGIFHTDSFQYNTPQKIRKNGNGYFQKTVKSNSNREAEMTSSKNDGMTSDFFQKR